MEEPLTWTVEIIFTESDDKTRADAVLAGAPDELRGWGRARKNPADPDLPAVAEEVAAARALTDLAHHLLDQAAHRIESWEGHPVQLKG
jgi:hypothetical protein